MQPLSEKKATQHSGAQLEIAHQRLLAYLKALRVPVRTRYEIADRALASAEAACAPDGDFIASAMQSLNRILAETAPARAFEKELAAIRPMPPLNRGGMLPVSMERSGPFTFFFMMFAGAARRLMSPPVRVYFLLVILAALLVYYWWLQ